MEENEYTLVPISDDFTEDGKLLFSFQGEVFTLGPSEEYSDQESSDDVKKMIREASYSIELGASSNGKWRVIVMGRQLPSPSCTGMNDDEGPYLFMELSDKLQALVGIDVVSEVIKDKLESLAKQYLALGSMMKPFKHFYIPVFDQWFSVYLDLDSAIKEIGVEFQEDTLATHFKKTSKTNTPSVVFRGISEATNGIITHEAVHLAMHVLHRKGVDIDMESHEILAYLVEYLVVEITSFVDKYKRSLEKGK